MAYNFEQIMTLISALEIERPVPTFLRSRYCPDGTLFDTERVMLQFKDGDRRLAPAVNVRKGSVPVDRGRFDALIISPPRFGAHRVTTIDDLHIKGFGEGLYTNVPIERRKRALALLDAKELRELFLRREEWLVARMMQDNMISLKEVIDDTETGNDVDISFYPGELTNPAVWLPPTSWSDPAAKILTDLAPVILERRRQGIQTTDVLMGASVVPYLLENEQIQQMRDKNFGDTLARVNPHELPNGASYFGSFTTAFGDRLDFLVYSEQYEDADGTIKSFMDEDKIVLCAPDTAKMHFGAIEQKDESGAWRTYKAKYVPRNTGSVDEDADKARLVSRPIPCPNRKNVFTSATVLF